MSADQLDLAAVPADELAEPLLVLLADLAVRLDDGLEGAQAARTVRRRAHLVAKEVRVAAVQQPIVVAPYSDTGVTERVPGQRDQQDLGVAVRQHPDTFEPEPVVAAELVRDPPRPVRPVRFADRVAHALAHRWALHRFVFTGPQVDLGRREVRQAAGVVEVEVGHDDVLDIRRIEAERAHLRDRCLAQLEPRAHHPVERRAAPGRRVYVGRAEAGVHERQPVGALDQQHMTDDARVVADDVASSDRAHRPTVEVVDSPGRHGPHRMANGATPGFAWRPSMAPRSRPAWSRPRYRASSRPPTSRRAHRPRCGASGAYAAPLARRRARRRS